jgi:hypothetical protein
MRQAQSLEELYSPLEEEGDCPEAWQEWPRHRRRPREESGRQALLSPRLDQHLRHSRALSKYATLWARLMPTLLESRRTHAQDIRHLRAGADCIRLFG